MSLSAYDRAIWSAMGLGPVWVERGQPAQAGESAQASTVRDAIAWVGAYETEADDAGQHWPAGPAGQLLLNMLKAAGIDARAQVFLGLHTPHGGSAPAAIAEQVRIRLQQSACAKAVLMGDNAARVLSALEPSGIRSSNAPYVLQLDSHRVACAAMEGLAELLSDPRRKALAWADLCRIKSQFMQDA